MGVGAGQIAGELYSVTPQMARPLDGHLHQDVADTVTPLVGVHVDGLDLGAERAVGLDVAEHNQLADANHASVPLGDQHPTRLPPDTADQD